MDGWIGLDFMPVGALEVFLEESIISISIRCMLHCIQVYWRELGI